MDDKILGLMTPEEAELEIKKNELKILKVKLSRHEECLRKLKCEMDKFEDKFTREIGIKFVKLDELDKKLGEFKKNQNNSNNYYYKSYGSNNYETVNNEVEKNESIFERSGENKKNLKNLYRKIVKQIHPDKVLDENEKSLRNELMAELNQAYAENNKEKMKKLFSEWKSRSNNMNCKGTDLELVKVIREINEINERIYKICMEFKELKNSDIFSFKMEIDYLNSLGIDGFHDICVQLDREIIKKEKQLILLSLLRLAAKNSKK